MLLEPSSDFMHAPHLPPLERKRVLFVDDENSVLNGLRRLLAPLRKEWDMVFVDSGKAALAAIDAQAFDVVVSDMRMPEMNGAELLARVQRDHPGTVRIILSGYCDRQMVMLTIGTTHQFLNKPCCPELLQTTIRRACALRDLLASEKVARVASQMRSLPSLPWLYQELRREAQSPNSTMETIGNIIERDLGMTAKILQLVNSAFFGLPRHVSSAGQAAAFLGLETICSMVLSVGIFSEYDAQKSRELDKIWQHSLNVGAHARSIAEAQKCTRKNVDYAFLAGILHDLGDLVIAANLPDEHRRAAAIAAAKKIPLWQAEQEVLGASHAEVGAYLLGLWGMPDALIEAVAFHHRPQACAERAFSPLSAVYIANLIEKYGSESGSIDERADAYLAELGCSDRLPAWIELCEQASAKDD